LKTDNQNNVQEKNRWLRVGLLIFTLIGPIVNTIVERMRQRSQSLQNTAPKKLKISQAAARQRIEELTQASRHLAVERAQILQEQANQLQAQAQQLRKALNENARQSRKVAEQFRKTSGELSRELLKRSELLTEELSERGNKLVERSSQVTQDLTKRGKKAAHDLAERSEGLLEPVRQRNSTFWTVLGFSIGLIAALVATYVFVRQRLLKPATDEDEQIELPQNGYRTQTTTAEPSAQPTKVE
jgi:DNA anti-recombination protein RmuC